MIIKTPIYHLMFAAFLGLIASCSSSDSSTVQPGTDATLTDPDKQISDDPTDTINDRLLDTAASGTKTLEINTCFCLTPYTDTTKIYNFTDQQAVLVLTFDNDDISFAHVARLYFFPATDSEDRISRWINNLYSDALFSNAARPLANYTLAEESLSITSRTPIEATTELDSDDYDSYQVEFSVANQSEGSEYTLTGFSDSVIINLLRDSNTARR